MMVLSTTQIAVHSGGTRRLAAAQDTQAAAGVRLRAAQAAALLGGSYDPDELDHLIVAARQARSAADAAFTAWLAGITGAARTHGLRTARSWQGRGEANVRRTGQLPTCLL